MSIKYVDGSGQEHHIAGTTGSAEDCYYDASVSGLQNTNNNVQGAIDTLNSNLVNIKKISSITFDSEGGWVDDVLGLPLPTDRAVYNIYNSSHGEFGHLIKRSTDNKIFCSISVATGNTVYINGVNS